MQNEYQIRNLEAKIHRLKKKVLFLYVLKLQYYHSLSNLTHNVCFRVYRILMCIEEDLKYCWYDCYIAYFSHCHQ